MQKILFVVSEDWYFVSHRLYLAKLAVEHGYKVSLLTNISVHQDLIEHHGITIIPWSLSRRSINPLSELRSIFQVIFTIIRVKPSLIHAVALKPILYGAIAAKITHLQSRVFAFAGLGFVFTRNTFFIKLLRIPFSMTMRALLKNKSSTVILQNPDDQKTLLDLKIISENQIHLIRGAGVDIKYFSPSDNLPQLDRPIVMLPARLLWDKGVGDFVEAAKILRLQGCLARFILVGDADAHNPAHIPDSQIIEWKESGVVECWGYQKNMPDLFNQAALVCLPSYREGLPKALLEAASCAKAIIATDVPGCREVVLEGVNGILVPPQSPEKLATAINILLKDPDLARKMGEEGLTMVRKNFSQEIIANQILTLWHSVLHSAE
jgi:glycosyltransferase involved in cell wall biosynthesis